MSRLGLLLKKSHEIVIGNFFLGLTFLRLEENARARDNTPIGLEGEIFADLWMDHFYE
jgi:hypothetical protein